MSRVVCVGMIAWVVTLTPACGAGTAPSLAEFPDSTRRLSEEPRVTLESGGTPLDEHGLALRRQLEEPWHRRADKDEQLLVPLADAGKWKRVRFWLIDHFTGFRYGDDFHALNVVFVHDVEPGTKVTPQSCMKDAERWARPQLRAFDVRMGPIQSRAVQWRDTEIPVRVADALVDYGTGPTQFSAAWAAYPAV